MTDEPVLFIRREDAERFIEEVRDGCDLACGGSGSPLPPQWLYERSARIARTSAPSEMVELKKLMTSSPEMSVDARQLSVYSGTQSVRVAAAA